MGARATFHVFSDDHDGAFSTGWGSPQFKLSAIARWIDACRSSNQLPSATNYAEHAETDPGDHFIETMAVDAADPGDLDYRYELKATKVGHGWIADLTVWRRTRGYEAKPYSTPQYKAHAAATFSNLDTSDLHTLAAEGLRTLITASAGRPDVPAEAIAAWTQQAEIHTAHSLTDAESAPTRTIRVNARHLTSAEVEAELEAIDGSQPGITGQAAVTIASWWQSPGTTGHVLAGFASGAQIDAGDLLDDVHRTIAQQGTDLDHASRKALTALADWVTNHSAGYEGMA